MVRRSTRHWNGHSEAMDPAFLLVVAKQADGRNVDLRGPRGGAVPQGPLDLGFVADRHEAWSAPPMPVPSESTSASLMEAIRVTPSDERMAYLPTAFEAVDNPVWDVIDRGRTLAAAERCTTLDAVERAELFGAATAAMWLGDLTSPAPLR